MKISAGSLNAHQNRERITYSPAEGFKFGGTLTGPKEAIKALVHQMAGLGWTFVYECDQSPISTIQFDSSGEPTGGGTETPTLVWEYFSNRLEIDILEADISNVNSIADDELRLIRKHIQDPEEVSPALTSSNAINLYQLMLKGVRSVRVNVPTLRLSKLVSNTYAVQASQANVGRVITSATLSTQENVPTRLFVLPTTVSTKSGFVYAWYKNFPMITQSTAGRWQISQEWEFGLWPTFLYGAAL